MKLFNLLFFGVFSSILAPNFSLSQGIYLELNTGYALPMASQEITAIASYNAVDYSYNRESVSGSFGKGLNAALKVGYLFNQNVGIEFHADCHFSAKYEGEEKYYDNSSWNQYSLSSKSNLQSTMIRIVPTLVYELPLKRPTPYARIGIVIGFASFSGETIFNSSDGNSLEYKLKMNGGVSIGSSAEIGVKVGLTKKLSFTAGIKAIGLCAAPKRGEFTSYKENGVDKLYTLSTSEREVEFVDNVSYSSQTNDPTKSGKVSKEYFPYSSIGLSIGLRYSF
jgi:hypothetical protein